MPDDYGLTCQELVEVVTDYLERTLPSDQVLLFERHLTHCRHCRTYLEQMRQTIRVLGSLPVEAVPDHAMAELRRAFRDWRP